MSKDPTPQEIKSKVRELINRQQWLRAELSGLDRRIIATFTPPTPKTLERGNQVGPFDITFDPKCYSGSYQVYVAYGAQVANYTGPCTLRLQPGDYFVQVAGGSFPFTVSKTGDLVLNAGVPAKISNRNHLDFIVRKIVIDPGDYDGAYCLTGHYAIPLRGKQAVYIVAGLPTSLNVYGVYGGTEIDFTTDLEGKIDPASIRPQGAALLKNGKLTFQTSPITVSPGAFTGGYILAGHYCEPSQQSQSFNVVKALTCYIEFYGCGYSQEVVFVVDGNGQISPTSVSNPLAVTAAGATLTVNSTQVAIQTTFTGRYRIGNTFLGQVQVVQPETFYMVNNYQTFIEIIDSQAAFITPRATGIDPANVSIPDESNTMQNFSFSYV